MSKLVNLTLTIGIILFLNANASADDDDDTDPPPGGGTGNYVLLGANDLGMHCADQDYQVFSILPPFNVVHAQVIEKGDRPRIVDDTEVSVTYEAAARQEDPAGVNSINTGSGGPVFKTNFWDLSGTPNPLSFNNGELTFGGKNYQRLYPSVLAASLLQPPVDLSGECGNAGPVSDCPSILNVFEPLPVDMGIPVPLGEKLAQGVLETTQQVMPGGSNAPVEFKRFDKEVGFFTKFDFGSHLTDRNWFAADGIPILPIDDMGNVNAYPLMKLAAISKQDQTTLASLDVVLPVASEADCHSCHATEIDCAATDILSPNSCNESGLQTLSELSPDRIMDSGDAPGDNPEQQLINAAKINVLRTHDLKHGATYTAANGDSRACDPENDPNNHCLDSRRSIQCAQCHYTPALDLTQEGPVDEPEQGPNGRQQTRHITMSRAMHGHHGDLPDFESQELFPDMPDPINRDPALAEAVLQETCYMCHPGKRTDCLRGAMATGEVVCQDCHGDMQEVGNDFSLRVSTQNPGDFILDGSLRVPWASEAKCQSCHTGDALNGNHPADAIVADDGIRLLKAYKSETIQVASVADPVRVASMIDSPQSRFAENKSHNVTKDQEVDVLYRLSTGHGGVKCESCHNSTHAIWPTKNPYANDNVASNQLQGHAGTVVECDTCHTPGSLGNTLGGPHGMHPVGGGEFTDGGHEDLAEDEANECRACHGQNGEGSVLSKVAVNREFVIEECEDGTLCPNQEREDFVVSLAKGDEVSCVMCHENEL